MQDQARFEDAFKKAGYNAQILFSQGDSAKEKANVESLISQGRQGHHHLPRRTRLLLPPRPHEAREGGRQGHLL